MFHVPKTRTNVGVIVREIQSRLTSYYDFDVDVLPINDEEN